MASAAESPVSMIRKQLCKTEVFLIKARSDLQSLPLPSILAAVRDHVLQPWLEVGTILAPTILIKFPPVVDSIIAGTLNAFRLQPLLWGFHQVSSSVPPAPSLRQQARQQLLRMPVASHVHIPSDLQSLILAILALCLSSALDVGGLFLDRSKAKAWATAIDQFVTYAHQSGVGREVLVNAIARPLLRFRFFTDIELLATCQTEIEQDRPVDPTDRVELNPTELEEGRRYMRFATAAYGLIMIESARDPTERWSKRVQIQEIVARHADIPVGAIRELDVSNGGSLNLLRHFLAVDERTSSVVLAIRGTLSISEVLVDMDGEADQFCGSWAHQGMARQAPAIWAAVEGTLKEVLGEYPQYRLVLTGHSLGAGTACLLHILIQVEQLLIDREVVCYAFAPPPTIELPPKPSPALIKAMNTCVGFVHDYDCVPLLSVLSVRRLAFLLNAMEEQTQAGHRQMSPDLLNAIRLADAQSFPEMKEHPVSGQADVIIPARVVYWMKGKDASREFIPCRPKVMQDRNIRLCRRMMDDHSPEFYEDALDMDTNRTS